MKFHSTWLTEFEKSGFLRSPRYKYSMAYFRRFELKTPYAKMFSIGMSPQGRSIECLVVSKDKEFTPDSAHSSNKAVVLIQNGIHAGEIEGKDASMVLLRDILVTKEKFHLLDNLILIVIPILNVDGHERISEFNRPNQNGPEEMGWRTNSQNLNLNRDYLKADTPEIRAFLQLCNSWRPDFFIDNHTTNGADYQYHVTYAAETNENIDQQLGSWCNQSFLPTLASTVEHDGFLTAPYIQFKNGTIESGIEISPAIPRLSTGYMAVQNRLGLLVETHSLKPFENRVRSTYSMNRASLEILNRKCKTLKKLNAQADKRSAKLQSIPIRFELENFSKAFHFKGFKSTNEVSPILGSDVIRYSSEPVVQIIPLFEQSKVSKSIQTPKGYVVPQEFAYLIDILTLHGIKTEQLKSEKGLNIEEYSFSSFRFAQKPYEGRMCVDVTCTSQQKKSVFPSGTYIVRTNQRTNRLIVNLLEPEGPDSFVSWGFFNAFFERKEYAEAYIMEPIALEMLMRDDQLKNDFELMLGDEHFRNNAGARLDYFYKKSPYFDSKEKKYPIFRLI